MDKPSAAFRPNLQLTLGTVFFGICFAAWGLISAFAPRFREAFHLTATQTAFLIAVPVLLGSVMRIVTGMLADRFGGRSVFAELMAVVAIPAFVVPLVSSYEKLLYLAFFLGIAGSSFAVGVGFVSRWFPPEKQGGALGIYGLGNIGQSAAVFLGPVLAALVGWQNIFRGATVLLVVWGLTFYALARNAPEQSGRHQKVTRKQQARTTVVKRDLSLVVPRRGDHIDGSITEMDLGETVRPVAETVVTSDAVNVKPDHLNTGQMCELSITCTMVKVPMGMNYKQKKFCSSFYGKQAHHRIC